MNTADPRSQPLFEMGACAYRLGMAFGAEAERAQDLDKKIEWFQLFERCFFGFRVATALELRLRRASAEPREAISDREALIERPDAHERSDSERETRDRGYDERDREGDREIERASFPMLVRTLEGIAADAAALPGPEPADVSTLRELLAKTASAPHTAVAAHNLVPGLRARLTGSSGAATALALAPRRPPGAIGSGGGPLATRRATGPPPR